MTHLIVSEQNKNTEVHLHIGDELAVRLEAQPGTGYSWMVSENIDANLSQIGEPVFEKTDKILLGGIEVQVSTFRARSTGVCRLVMEYRRPWEKAGKSTSSFSITAIIEK